MIDITVAFATPEKQLEIPLTVEESCTVALAIDRSAICAQFPEISRSNLVVGINSRRVTLDSLLQSGDRIEIYRPLTIDPKEARRSRVAKKKT